MNPQFLIDTLASVPDEVVLARPPLKVALVQIRFPTVLSIGQPDFSQVAVFQELMRNDYPNYEEQSHISVPTGSSAQLQISHTLKSEDGWSIGLNRDAIALSTTKYKTKEEFADRAGKMAEAAKSAFDISKVTRLGARFIDRVEDDAIIRDIGKYVRPEFLGPFPQMTQFSFTQYNLVVAENVLLNLHWGLFPPNQAMPASEIPPHSNFSWVLDSDMYTQNPMPFDPNQIMETTKAFSGSIYAIFRHVFNDDFISTCGEKI